MADFQFFHNFIFTNGSAKSSGTAMGSSFFEGLNFMNDQHPRNSWNLDTSKKTNYTVLLISDEYIRIQEQLNDFCTPHVIRSTMVPRFC